MFPKKKAKKRVVTKAPPAPPSEPRDREKPDPTAKEPQLADKALQRSRDFLSKEHGTMPESHEAYIKAKKMLAKAMEALG